METEIVKDAEIITSGVAMEAATRGELDSQVSTARKFPRSIKNFVDTAMELATLDEETSGTMFYTLPARKGGYKPIEGPSIRLAEVVAYSWKNLRVETNIESIDETHVTAVGTVFDTERNSAYRHRVKRRIVDKYGKRYSEDVILTTCNAASSIAFREAVFKAVPRAFVNKVYLAARATAVGTQETLVSRRTKAMEWFKKAGADEKMVLEKLGRKSLDEVTLDDLVTLTGFKTAIREGDTKIDEVFAKEEAQVTSASLTAALKKPKQVKTPVIEEPEVDWDKIEKDIRDEESAAAYEV